ncbi:MFS transporter [Leptolyngbya sp. FACHB-671]|uniref:MFS transporter n=1 Tax=Leptolyngbya sp. FACHB-671 TaxID=2692812 RepID=UPI00168322C4|nr:MFS transporter [Leptolyngbya sp. FACHB-671]MBD2070229.1 MFS transporter [Leptolyngbya sp. FACHB-671]
MKLLKTLSPKLQHDLLVLFAAGLLFWSGLAALLPTLPLYIQDAGGTSQDIGIVMGAFAVGLLASRPSLATLADRRGRKIVLLIGIAAVAIAPLGYLLTDSIPLLIAIRAFHGISISAFALAYTALVVDLSPVEHRGELIGYMSLVNPLGLALGPAMGGFLQEWVGYEPMFLAAAALGGLGWICTARIQEPESVHPLDPSSAQPSGQFWQMLGSPRIRIPATVLLLIGLAFGTLSTFVPLFIKEVGVNLNVGLFYTAAAIASFGIRIVAGRASDRYGRGPFITLSLVFYTTAMMLLWQANSAASFLLAGAIQGAGSGTLIPMISALMADRSHANERGKVFGLCMVGFDVGIAIAGPIAGAIATQTGYKNVFGLTAGLAFLSLIVFLTLSSKSLGHSFQFATGRGEDVYAIK